MTIPVKSRTLLDWVALILVLLAACVPGPGRARAEDDDAPLKAEKEMGLGIEWKSEKGMLRVVSVVRGGPAERAGLIKGDLLLAIDGQATADLTAEKLTELLKGNEGSPLLLAVVSKGKQARAVRVVRGAVAASAPMPQVQAQVQRRAVTVQIGVPNELIEAQVKGYVEPLRERLPLEVQFIDKVCGLTEQQTLALEEAGRAAIDRVAQKMTAVLSQNMRGSRMAVVINGRAVAVPAGLDQEVLTSPHQVVRRELTQALKLGWPEAWEKFDAERQRLETRRRQACILAQVAVLDECLLLSSEQRKTFSELLTRPTSDAFWRPANRAPALNPAVERLQASLAGGDLGQFFIAEVDMAKLLQPSQLVAFKELQRPRREEVVMVQQGGRQPMQAGAAPAAGAPAAPVRRQIIRQGPRTEDAQRQLAAYIERAVGDLDAACGLSDAQKQKLLLAGTLDIEAWREQVPAPPEKLPPGQEMVIQMVQVMGGNSRLPSSIFSDAASRYQKALRNRLLDEQKERLAAALRERREFQRQALVAVVVAGVERSAALTSAQCEALATLFDAAPSARPEAMNDWRVDYLRGIAQLPEEDVRPVFSDFQWPAASQQLAKLNDEARHFQSQVSANVAAGAPAAGVGKF